VAGYFGGEAGELNGFGNIALDSWSEGGSYGWFSHVDRHHNRLKLDSNPLSGHICPGL